MKNILLNFLCSFLLIGCQTGQLSTQMKSHAPQHEIQLMLDQSAQGLISFPSIKHRLIAGEFSLSIQGLIRKPLGKQLSKAKIRAVFLDDQKNILFEEIGDVTVSRTHLHRGTRGRFTLNTKDNEAVSICRLSLEWNKE